MKDAKLQAYMTALLKNPKFFEWAAKRYGTLLTTGEGLVCDLGADKVASAVADLERFLSTKVQGDNTN